MNLQPDPYMDINDLAEYSHINKRQLRVLVKAMPYFKPGRKILVKKSVFDAYMRKYLVNVHPLAQRVIHELKGY